MGNSCFVITKSDIKLKHAKRKNLRNINLLRYKCIYCGKNGIFEKKLGKYVWAECSYCNKSGYDNRINDTINVSSMDLVLTL